MIKKVVLLFFILFNLTPLLNSENLIDLSNDMFFYVPYEEHAADYINFYNYLKQWEENKVIINDEKLLKFYKDFAGQKTLHGFIFEAFLRQTKNKNIQKQVLFMIKGYKLDDVFSVILTRLYNSRKKQIEMGDNNQLQYSYNEEYFDENINLFKQNEYLAFKNELGLMLFDNPWTNLSYNSRNKVYSENDSFFLMYGGGTNSMTIHFYKMINIIFEEFKSREIEGKYNAEKYGNWKVQEIEIKGILKKANADKIFICTGTGPDLFPEIESGTFSILLYNEKLERGYSISYYMNFSKINNNFEMRQRIWNHLLMQLIFSFINVK